MNTENIYFYLPESLANLQELLINHGQDNLGTYHLDKVAYIIHTLYVKRFINKTYSYDSFIQLHSDKLIELLGRDYYKAILNFLIYQGIIECNGTYKEKSFCLGYRLTERYRSEMFYLTMANDSWFINKLKAFNKSELKTDIRLYNSLKVNLESIQIDLNKAIKEVLNKFYISNHTLIPSNINSIINNLILSIKSKYSLLCLLTPSKTLDMTEFQQAKTFGRGTENMSFEALLSNLCVISKIYHGQFFFEVDNKGFRVHTNYSNLPAILRPYITINGKSLEAIDIRNSQPLFFACFVKSYYKERHRELPEDAKTYVSLCEQGKFYEYIFDGLTEQKRKEYKQDFFGKVFFCQNKHMQNKLADLFKDKFPSLYRIIQEQKKDNYKALAINLQKLESDLIVRVVAKNMLKKYPAMELLTIHDSISVPKEYFAETQQEIISAFKKYGVQPSFKKDRYDYYRLLFCVDGNGKKEIKEFNTELKKDLCLIELKQKNNNAKIASMEPAISNPIECSTPIQIMPVSSPIEPQIKSQQERRNELLQRILEKEKRELAEVA